MASTGSSLDAEIAGIIPEINPIAADIIVPINMFVGESTNSKSPVKLDAIMDAINTRNKPIRPPIIAKITASNKNCSKMNLFFAPSDF